MLANRSNEDKYVMQTMNKFLHIYHQVSNISRTLQRDKIADRSDVVGASPAIAAPTTSSFST